jgi:AraC-like DNA-binding protein
LSYFNHSFRRRYGATPSDIRANRTQDNGVT